MTLRWEPTPYRRRTDDVVADLPSGLGRYRVRWDKLTKRYNVYYNGSLVASELTFDEAKDRAERGGKLLFNRAMGTDI